MRPIAHHRLAWLALALMLVAGCAPTPTRIETDSALQNQLRQLQQWQAEGKLGLRYKGEAHSAYFDWQQRADGFALRLSGPFGQGTTWLKRNGDAVSLESADSPIRYASSAEKLMQARLGWQVPVSNLRYWVRGLAAPNAEVQDLSRNPDGTLAQLRQQGWDIIYKGYQEHNGWALPRKLVAERGQIRLTMVVKNWQLAAPRGVGAAAGATR